jgi:hypothetical protein
MTMSDMFPGAARLTNMFVRRQNFACNGDGAPKAAGRVRY